jgi:predicted enzyme related to lactoylglutathione lyase
MPNICVISVYVSDLEQAKQFYCDIVGFEISKTYGDEVISLQHEGVSLILQKTDKDTHHDYPRESQVIIGIHSLDIQSSIAELQSKGAEVIFDTPQPCPAGLYNAIRDPFGNVIEYIEFRK